MSKYTSFVAIDKTVRNKSGKSSTVTQPAHLPESGTPRSSGRSGHYTLGFGGSSGGGFAGSSHGSSTIVGDLMSGPTSRTSVIKRGKRISRTRKVGKMAGGRSRPSIMRIVRRNMTALRYAYNSQLLKTPDIKGKIVVKWSIDASGKVISCRIVSSTMNNKAFEEIVRKKISRWKFKRINVPGDVTSITYPFVFQK